MSVFGSAPIEPRGPQAGLAAAAAARQPERTKALDERDQRMRDALAHRVAGAESEAAVRQTADQHDDNKRRQHDTKRGRRDGRRDRFEASDTASDTSGVAGGGAPASVPFRASDGVGADPSAPSDPSRVPPTTRLDVRG